MIEIQCQGQDLVRVCKVSWECYQILMHMEDTQEFKLIGYDQKIAGVQNFTGGYQYQHNTSKFQEKEINLKMDVKYLNALDSGDFDPEDDQDLVEYCSTKNMDPHYMRLYKDIFKLYDEGEYECVVQVLKLEVSDHPRVKA